MRSAAGAGPDRRRRNTQTDHPISRNRPNAEKNHDPASEQRRAPPWLLRRAALNHQLLVPWLAVVRKQPADDARPEAVGPGEELPDRLIGNRTCRICPPRRPPHHMLPASRTLRRSRKKLIIAPPTVQKTSGPRRSRSRPSSRLRRCRTGQADDQHDGRHLAGSEI